MPAGLWQIDEAAITITAMGAFRFVLILILTVALDLSSPVPQHGVAEIVEEFEEVTHARGSRRPFRRIRDSVPPPIAREVAPHRVGPVRPAPATPRVTAPVRKQPLPVSESSAGPQDH
jgi:hypothetical protein